jgi:cytoskeletal protein RodZ
LRTYAQVVGLDQRLALAELESALAPADTSGQPHEQQTEKAATSPLPYIAMTAAAIAVVAMLFVRIDNAPQPAPSVEGRAATDSPAQASATPATATSPTTEPILPAVPAPEVPAAPAMPASSATELVVTTQPEGARVTVNGIGWGNSPARIQYLEPGEKRVRVSKEGYVAVERVLRLDHGAREALDITLDASN